MRSLELLPDAPVTLSPLARALVLAKDFAKADEVFGRLEKIAPDDQAAASLARSAMPHGERRTRAWRSPKPRNSTPFWA